MLTSMHVPLSTFLATDPPPATDAWLILTDEGRELWRSSWREVLLTVRVLIATGAAPHSLRVERWLAGPRVLQSWAGWGLT